MKQRESVEVLPFVVFFLSFFLSFQSSPSRTVTAFRPIQSLSIAGPVAAQPSAPPSCDMSDSSLVYAQELDDIMHRFGEDTSTYPNEFDIASFDSAFTLVFDLIVTPNASNGWRTDQWQNMIVAIMNNDTSQTQDDIFGRVWTYFCRAEVDSNASHAGVRFNVGGTTYEKIEIRMYDRTDLPNSLNTCLNAGYPESACKGWSWYSLNRLYINASAAQLESDVLGLGVAHELQHLCFKLNGGQWNRYDNIDETLSTLAEYFEDSWRALDYDLSYDASIMRQETCDSNSKYQIERMWISYLYEVFKGITGDPTDDLIYRWIRNNSVTAVDRFKLTTLEDELWASDFDWVGGVDKADRLNKVFANYLVAKFCNASAFAANGVFGIGSLNTYLDFGLFQDNCIWRPAGSEPYVPDCPENLAFLPDGQYHDGCWNVRVLLPEYNIDESQENTSVSVSGLYEDGDAPLPAGDGDGSKDYIDVWGYGTDYIVFRADPYFQDCKSHELRIRLNGTPRKTIPSYGEWVRIRPVGWVMGYSTDAPALQTHPEALVFVEPISFTPATSVLDTLSANEMRVPGFGSVIKSVVVAIGNITEPQYSVPVNAFVYQYDYGVFPQESDLTIQVYSRVDETLYAQPCKAAAGCPQGDGDDVVVKVTLDPSFYSGPISMTDFSVTVPDSLALYAIAQADSDAALIDGKYRTTITLSKFGSCGAGPLTVLLNGESLGTVDVDMRSVDTETRLTPGVVQGGDFARFGSSYSSPPKPYDPCVDYREVGEVSGADFAFFGAHYNHSSSGGSASLAATAMTDATLRLDLVEENPLVGDRRLFATVSAENVEPFKALVVSLRSDHPRLRFLGWEPDSAYPSTTMGTEVTRDGVRQAFVGVIGDGKSLAPVVEFGQVEFEVLGEEPLVLSEEDLNFIIADLEVVGGGLRAFSPIRLEKNEVQPTYRFELAQNVPNPFNPSTTIAYSLAGDADVALAIFDVKGARVKTLVSGHETTGVHRVPWDGTNDRGARVSSGVYFYRLIAGSFKSTKKMVLLR